MTQLLCMLSLSKAYNFPLMNRYTFLTSSASSMMGVFGVGYKGGSPVIEGSCESDNVSCDPGVKVSDEPQEKMGHDTIAVSSITDWTLARAFIDFERYVRVASSSNR